MTLKCLITKKKCFFSALVQNPSTFENQIKLESNNTIMKYPRLQNNIRNIKAGIGFCSVQYFPKIQR